MPPSCTATAITCAMKPDDAVSGPRPVCSTHGASRPWIRSEANVSQSQSRPETSRLPPNSCDAAPPEPADRLAAEREAPRRPDLGAEQPEREVGVRHEPVEQLAPRGPVARRVAVELGRVRVGAAEQERRLAVGERGGRRQLGVQVLEAARGELVAEQRVGRAADPERMPAREHVVVEAGLGDLGRSDAAAEPVVALEHDDVPAGAREQRAAGERVDPAPDEDDVRLGRARAVRRRHRRSRPPASAARRTDSPRRRAPTVAASVASSTSAAATRTVSCEPTI